MKTTNIFVLNISPSGPSGKFWSIFKRFMFVHLRFKGLNERLTRTNKQQQQTLIECYQNLWKNWIVAHSLTHMFLSHLLLTAVIIKPKPWAWVIYFKSYKFYKGTCLVIWGLRYLPVSTLKLVFDTDST